MGTFWGGMPDLNFDHPKVREEMKDIGKFWLELGVDGFRIDAAKHIYEDLMSDKGEATTAKNTAWWQEFRASMNEVNPDAYIVGEIWDNSARSLRRIWITRLIPGSTLAWARALSVPR